MHLLLPADYPEDRAAALARRHRGLLLLRYRHETPRPLAGRLLRAAAHQWAPWQHHAEILARIDALWPARPRIEVASAGGSFEPLTGPLPGAEALYVPWSVGTPVLQALLPQLPSLRWIHSSMSGVDHITPALPAGKPMQMSSSTGLHSRRMAEFALALMLCARKQLLAHRALQFAATWGEPRSGDLAGELLLVLGGGSIGRATATQARIFGMRVEGVTRSGDADPHFDRSWGVGQLDELLPRARHLLLSLPLTDQTRGMLDARRLALLPPGAVIVNFGRHALMDELALLHCLRTPGRIALAALEDTRGLPRRHPLHHLPNALVTHHSAWSGETALPEIHQRFEENVARWVAGEPLAGQIDAQRGY